MALQYGPATALTISAGGLTSGSARSSAAVTTDTTKNVVAVMLEVQILTTASAPAGDKQVVVYGYRSLDGTDYSGASSVADNVDGTDKAVSLGTPSNLVFIGSVQLNQGANAVTITGVFDITNAFGCVPPKWGIVLLNGAGTTLGATVNASYREIYYT